MQGRGPGVEQGGGASESSCTLGDVESGASSCTLGHEVLIYVVLFGIDPVLFNCSARVSNALRTGSPTVSEGVVGDGGLVQI